MKVSPPHQISNSTISILSDCPRQSTSSSISAENHNRSSNIFFDSFPKRQKITHNINTKKRLDPFFDNFSTFNSSLLQVPRFFPQKPLDLQTPLAFVFQFLRTSPMLNLFQTYFRTVLNSTNKLISQIYPLSPLFLELMHNESTIYPIHLDKLIVTDFFYTLFQICQEKKLSYEAFFENKNFSAEIFILKADPVYALNWHISNLRWKRHSPTKRDKLAPEQIFQNRCAKYNIPHFASPEKFDLSTWHKFVNKFRRKWKSSFATRLRHRVPSFSTDQEQLARAYSLREKQNFSLSTNKWTMPPGCLKTLINTHIECFYKFIDGTRIFPIDYRKNNDPRDFFLRRKIPDGSLVNPPYDDEIITKVIITLIRWALNKRHTYAVLVPIWENKQWFKLCRLLRFPILKYKNCLAFQRGVTKIWCSTAPFKNAWILIGAFTTNKKLFIPNDKFGFPLSFKYLKDFQSIRFPQNLHASYTQISLKNKEDRIAILQTFLTIAKSYDIHHTPPSIANIFDFSGVIKFNFLLQHVDNSSQKFLHHNNKDLLDPYLAHHGDWPKIKHRQNLTMKDLYIFLKKFEENPDSAPHRKFQKHRCPICKHTKHSATHCPSRIFTSHELGLKAREDTLLYEFLTQHVDFVLTKNQNFSQFYSASAGCEKLRYWLQLEQIFWEKLRQFLSTENAISIAHKLAIDNEFSKGRQALGFNWAMGASKNELLIDAFGVPLDFVNPPPPCQIAAKFDNQGEPIYDTPTDHMCQEDLKALTNRTCYRVPKKHIVYILPRFIVTNTDTTLRLINDCRLLGASTITNRFRLPKKSDLRNIKKGDFVLSIDGKSAYKQRKLCWRDRCKIGFQTAINGKKCYIAVVTLPFGLHNAGFFYQTTLLKKLRRLCGHLFFVEYIDDVTIVFTSKNNDISQQSWVGTLLLYLNSKIGEIFNNKIDIFSEKITMIGYNYYPKTDRFTPKLGTLFKLCTQIIDFLDQKFYSLKNLESLIGRVLWQLPFEDRHLLQPFQFALKEGHKDLERFSKKGSRINERTTRWPINSLLMNNTFEIIAAIITQYLEVETYRFKITTKSVFIVVDSNPLVAGGFMFFRNRSSNFTKFKDLLVDQITISGLTPEFCEAYNLDKLLYSFRFEALGLLRFLEKHSDILHKLAKQSDCLVILMDNEGLVIKLLLANASTTLDFELHQQIFTKLRSFGKPFIFRWLRRSHAYLQAADFLGRKKALVKPLLRLGFLKQISKLFQTNFVTPKIFDLFRQFAPLMPISLFQFSLTTDQTILVILPPNIKLSNLHDCLDFLSLLSYKLVVGFPKLRNELLERVDKSQKFCQIPHHNFGKIFINHKALCKYYSRNCPMVFACLIKKHSACSFYS